MKKRVHVLVAAALLLVATTASTVARAEAPMVKTQAPGYYRTMLGDFEITALSDGTVKLPMIKLLTNAQPAKLKAALLRGIPFTPEMV